MTDDRRLIEDYLPIEAISAEASREKSSHKGHISTLHLWWARRPLVACRAAVYGALVPASRFVPKNGPEEKRASLGRANSAKFLKRLCKYPGDPRTITEAQRHILEAHAERLSHETGKQVTVEEIEAGRAPRPKVLDMFAGGGAIPLEALRLGCEAYALDLNPVAHIIELCTLVYPQKYGRPDPNVRGMTGPKNDKGETTWGGLAEEVRYWGNWVLEKVRQEIGDLYPPIPDPKAPKSRQPLGDAQLQMAGKGFDPRGQQKLSVEVPEGYLTPVAYLWTRTVTCKNPVCKAEVPLVRQTWLCKKDGRYVALKMVAQAAGLSSTGEPPVPPKRVRFEVVEAASAKGLGFDPEAGSKGGNATCPFCGTVADSDYVKAEGCAGRMGQRLMAVVCTRPDARGKVYLAAEEVPDVLPDGRAIEERIQALCKRTGLTVPSEPIINDAKNALFCVLYGFQTWGDIFIPRQMLCLLTFAAAVREAYQAMVGKASGLSIAGKISVPSGSCDKDRAKAVVSHLAIYLDRGADHWSSLCAWNPAGEKLQHTYGRQSLPMVWDFSEANPFGGSVGDWMAIVLNAEHGIWAGSSSGLLHGEVVRGSASSLPWPDRSFDAAITDPPYYDNVPYADISDFFYVWLKRTIDYLYPEHFASEGTPKRAEAVADATRHGGSKDKARRAYEEMMAQAFREAHRVLKLSGEMVIVYAHKTTLGWATLVDALRIAGFTVTEAWPLDTEMKTRLRGMDSAALASSIFLVARKREDEGRGNYEEEVRPELETIVRERVASLWEQGISGADLVIACVGAGLRAFTRFARVEYANGEEVPAERFLTEVETVVLESVLERLSKEVGSTGRTSLSGVDPATRCYTLWRYTYRMAELDAGEAIIFANGTHVELDGHGGLSSGARALVEKKKGKYRLRDYTERGDDEKLGMPGENGQPAPVIDALHRTLYLMENRPGKIAEFLREAQPNREQMRLVAQALAGPALKGGELVDVSPTGELAALARLTANWKSVVEDAVYSPQELTARRTGQERLELRERSRR